MSDNDELRLPQLTRAAVGHSSPFGQLEVPARHDDPTPGFIKRWIEPFYMLNLWKDSDAFVAAVCRVAPHLNETVTGELLSYFNWRPRLVGAYFVAVKRFAAFEEQIGRLLLRSDLTYAGTGYCAALASLNSAASVALLEEYLDYYLTRADLWFDQGVAMAALGYLDQQNRTTRRARFESQWHRFIENKPHWDLARDEATFRATMEALEAARRAA